MDNHDKFKKHLNESKKAVEFVKTYLEQFGYDPVINDNTVAETHADWAKHADNGDITLNCRIEVKQLGFNFTCADDFKYKPKFIVCAKHSYDNAKPKPLAYFYVSKDYRCIATVRSADKINWWVEDKKDSRYENFSQPCYITNVNNVQFEHNKFNFSN